MVLTHHGSLSPLPFDIARSAFSPDTAIPRRRDRGLELVLRRLDVHEWRSGVVFPVL